MRPLFILASLSKNFPGLPVVDLSGAVPLLQRHWRQNPTLPSALHVPFDRSIWGMTLDDSLRPIFNLIELTFKPPVQLAFVVNYINGVIHADPFAVLPGVPGIGSIEPGFELHWPGPPRPTRPMTDESRYRVLVSIWFEGLVLNSFHALVSSNELYLKDVDLSLTSKQKRTRDRIGALNAYKILASKEVRADG